jgi:hypothetical protein
VARIIRAAQLCVNPPGALFLPAFSNAYAAGPTVAGALSIKPNFGANARLANCSRSVGSRWSASRSQVGGEVVALDGHAQSSLDEARRANVRCCSLAVYFCVIALTARIGCVPDY